MAQTDELINAIRRLVSARRISYTSASQASDVYEGFIFSLVVATASRHGARVTYEDVGGNKVNDLVLRTSPGHIYSDTQPYTHALIEFEDAPPLEVHLGVYVQGTSGILHECDILVLPAREAVLCRAQRIAPRGSQCVLIIECKYYASRLGIDNARNFEGMRADVRTQDELFVSNIGTPSIARYLNARNREFERDVLPGSPQALYVQAEVRKAFKSFLSKNSSSTVI